MTNCCQWRKLLASKSPSLRSRRVRGVVVPVLAAAQGLRSFATMAETRKYTPAEQHLKNARALHQRLLTFDAHAEIETPGKPSMYVSADGLFRVAVAKMQVGDLDAVILGLLSRGYSHS